MKWDIFCKVIDNLGDIGVCWRLARQLAAEHGIAVRLWVDEPGALALLLPGFDAGRAHQSMAGVEIIHWTPASDFTGLMTTDGVIEAFACELPDSALRAMTARTPPPCWINLEYLSAEPWVEDCHGMASPHPRLPLVKFFFFPGFTPKTGGLIREQDLFLRQGHFLRHSGRQRLLAFLGIETEANLPLVSFFCYDTAPVKALLQAWRNTPLLCLVPPGQPLAAVQNCLGGNGPWQYEKARLFPIPFMPQADYDELLWACDLNFIRGEDSFIRAQWAGKPLIWQLYPQENDTRSKKLAAFLKRYTADFPIAKETLKETLGAFWQDWNARGENLARLWPALYRDLPLLKTHAEHWRDQLARQDDLATALVKFCKSKV